MFRLGEFGKGLVTGLAESANVALKDDMKRIDDRIESISNFRIQKAIDEQEERKEEYEEIKKALKEGGALFGADNPLSAQYAAGLLKEQGSIDAYRSLVAELRNSKNEFGLDLSKYMSASSENNPAGSYSDYAKAYQGLAKTTTAKLPDVDMGVPTMLDNLGFNVDIAGRVQKETQRGLTARGIAVDTNVQLMSLPTIRFERFDYQLDKLPFEERIVKLNEELSKPENTDERNTELNKKLNAHIEARIEKGTNLQRIQGLNLKLDMVEPNSDEARDLVKQIQTLRLDTDIQVAQAANEPAKVAKLKANAAFINGDMAEFKKQFAEAQSIEKGRGKTIADSIEDISAELADLEKKKNTLPDEEYQKEKKTLIDASIKLAKIAEEMVDSDTGEITESQFNSAASLVDGEIDRELEVSLGIVQGREFLVLQERITNLGATFDDFTPTEQELYLRGLEEKSKIENRVFNRIISQFNEKDNPALFVLGRTRGYLQSNVPPSLSDANVSPASSFAMLPDDEIASASTTQGSNVNEDEMPTVPSSTTNLEATSEFAMVADDEINTTQPTTAVANLPNQPVTVNKATNKTITAPNVTQTELDTVTARFPDTPSEALNAFNELTSQNDNFTIDDVIEFFDEYGYSESFLDALRKIATEESLTRAESVPGSLDKRKSLTQSDLTQFGTSRPAIIPRLPSEEGPQKSRPTKTISGLMSPRSEEDIENLKKLRQEAITSNPNRKLSRVPLAYQRGII